MKYICLTASLLLFQSLVWAAPSINFSVIDTANSSPTLEAMVVSGGDFTDIRRLAQGAVLVTHPQGDFMWDSGLGRELEAQMDVFSFFDKQLFSIENYAPARDQLEAQGYDFTRLKMIIPSHMHWDHASGIEDFPEADVWIQEQSYVEAFAGKPPGFVRAQFDAETVKWKKIRLNDTVYEGFQRSLDIYNDGSAVLVDLNGHSDGHLGLFVNVSEEQRYLFIGDTTWVIEGVENNRSRPSFVQWVVGVDSDFDLNAKAVDYLHNFSLANPSVMIVPAHDERVNDRLPQYPDFLPTNNDL